MSKIIYLLAMTIIVSCSSTRILEGIAIYECERVGESFPSYIVLKGGPLNNVISLSSVMVLLLLMQLKKTPYMFFLNLDILLILSIIWIL